MPQDSDMGSFSSPSATMKAANFQVMQGKVSTDFYKQSINFSCEFITTVGAFILILGVAISTVNIFVSLVNDCVGTEYPMLMSLQRNKQYAATFARVRVQLGEITAFGLEVLVVSNVLETIVKGVDVYSYESLGKIAAIALFRTFLAYFLGKEFRGIRHTTETERDTSLSNKS